MRILTRCIVALILLVLCAPLTTLAQSPEWSEQRTTHFAILFAPGDDQVAQEYAGFVDELYDEIAAVFATQPATPITLRLYPTLESYYTVNPLAREVRGIVAHADYRRNEVVVIVPQTREQTDVEVRNNIRHELTHIIAADLTADRLNVGFQEGLAQYVEQPAPELETKIALLQQALDNDRLLPWSALDDREAIYGSPEVGYPQTLSIVSFLAERYTFEKVREFLAVSARSSGYRSALERAFEVSPATLEAEWLEWLPNYLAGGYRLTTVNSYDLTRIEALIERGSYAEAERELATAIGWLRNAEQPDELARAEELLVQTQQGQQADTLMRDARTAIEQAAYEQALDIIEQARGTYTALGDSERLALLDTYANHAMRGLRAGAVLGQAHELAGDWRMTPQARAVADQAAAEFVALGDRARADEALALRAQIDGRQRSVGIVLLIFGVGSVLVSVARWLTIRDVEVW